MQAMFLIHFGKCENVEQVKRSKFEFETLRCIDESQSIEVDKRRCKNRFTKAKKRRKDEPNEEARTMKLMRYGVRVGIEKTLKQPIQALDVS